MFTFAGNAVNYLKNKLIPNPTSTSEAPKVPEEKVEPVQFSTLEYYRNAALSYVVPTKVAVKAHELFGSSSMDGPFKQFIDELKDCLTARGGTPEYLSHLIPEYVTLSVQEKMRTGEILTYDKTLTHYLTQAYNDKLSEDLRNQYKMEAFKTILSPVGPLGLKFIQSQTVKDSKNPDHWANKAIRLVQSNLPPISVEEVEKQLKEAFDKQGTIEFVENFNKHFTVKKILGAGTIGTTALVEYQENAFAEKMEIVVKIIKDDSRTKLQNDGNLFNKAADNLLLKKLASPLETKAFKSLNNKLVVERLKEANTNLENAHLLNELYEGPGVTTVRGIPDLFAKSHNVVFMKKADGKELSKYINNIKIILANTDLSTEEREVYLREIFILRKHYTKFMKLHFQHINENKAVHGDPHAGNIFYHQDHPVNKKQKYHGKLSILDVGSVVLPVSDEEHHKLQQFLFAVYLSIGTGDAEFIRMYYKNLEEKQQISAEKTEPLVLEIQDKLNQIKSNSIDCAVLDIDKASTDIMNIFATAALMKEATLIPESLVLLSRGNELISEQLHELDTILAGTKFAEQISYFERTQLGITLKAALDINKAKSKALWTEETWDYFKKICTSASSEQLKFEKKFIYGIFGLTQTDAIWADALGISLVFGAPIAVTIGAIFMSKKSKEVAQYALNHEYFTHLKKHYGDKISTPKFLSDLDDFLKKKNFGTFFKKTETLPLHKFPQEKLSSSSLAKPSPTSLFKPRVKMGGPFVAGMIVGGAIVGEAVEGYRRYCKA